jgi:predicted RNase H-like HicB family nuclease
MRLTATVEQAEDGSWTASITTENDLILGDGDTKEAAIENLREGVKGLIAYLKSKGQTLPETKAELVSIEVAA